MRTIIELKRVTEEISTNIGNIHSWISSLLARIANTDLNAIDGKGLYELFVGNNDEHYFKMRGYLGDLVTYEDTLAEIESEFIERSQQDSRALVQQASIVMETNPKTRTIFQQLQQNAGNVFSFTNDHFSMNETELDGINIPIDEALDNSDEAMITLGARTRKLTKDINEMKQLMSNLATQHQETAELIQSFMDQRKALEDRLKRLQALSSASQVTVNPARIHASTFSNTCNTSDTNLNNAASSSSSIPEETSQITKDMPKL